MSDPHLPSRLSQSCLVHLSSLPHRPTRSSLACPLYQPNLPIPVISRPPSARARRPSHSQAHCCRPARSVLSVRQRRWTPAPPHPGPAGPGPRSRLAAASPATTPARPGTAGPACHRSARCCPGCRSNRCCRSCVCCGGNGDSLPLLDGLELGLELGLVLVLVLPPDVEGNGDGVEGAEEPGGCGSDGGDGMDGVCVEVLAAQPARPSAQATGQTRPRT